MYQNSQNFSCHRKFEILLKNPSVNPRSCFSAKSKSSFLETLMCIAVCMLWSGKFGGLENTPSRAPDRNENIGHPSPLSLTLLVSTTTLSHLSLLSMGLFDATPTSRFALDLAEAQPNTPAPKKMKRSRPDRSKNCISGVEQHSRHSTTPTPTKF